MRKPSLPETHKIYDVSSFEIAKTSNYNKINYDRIVCCSQLLLSDAKNKPNSVLIIIIASIAIDDILDHVRTGLVGPFHVLGVILHNLIHAPQFIVQRL